MEFKELLKKYGFFDGKMISLSKTRYRIFHPWNLVVFNAYILCVPRYEEPLALQQCDIDITKEHRKLKALSKEADIFIYTEMKTYLVAHYAHGKRIYQIPWHSFLNWLKTPIRRYRSWKYWRQLKK